VRLGAVGRGTAASTGLKVDQANQQSRGAADCGEHRQAAGAIEKALN